VVKDLGETPDHPHFAARGLFAHGVTNGQESMPALPVPVDPGFRRPAGARAYPRLGEANAELLPTPAND
jgi:crotonobetainyl-CoA:carnitine CoA-transferase CaiB-like acyl-CoA transferase